MNVESWRARLPAAVVEEIDKAIERCAWARAYEAAGPKVRNTLEALREISAFAGTLRRAIIDFKCTPIGMAGIFEAAQAERIDFGRYEIASLEPILHYLAKYAAAAADNLQNRFSPMPGEGQGAGSSEGSLSDYRIIGFESDKWRQLFHFRSPKDIFGFRVLLAIYSDPVACLIYRKRARPLLASLLNEVWTDEIEPTAQSWTILLRDLAQIRELAANSQIDKATWEKHMSLSADDEDTLPR